MPRAQRDLAEALRYIAADNPSAAERVRERLLDVMQRLLLGELSGPDVTLSDGRRVRRWSVAPYRIYYRFIADRMEVLRIYHQARRPVER